VGEGEVANAVNEAEFLAFGTRKPLALHRFGRDAGAGGFHEVLVFRGLLTGWTG